MFHFDTGGIMMVMIFSVPIVAIVGGVAAGIVRTLGRQRIAELAYQERIAALQRGVDLSKLPPVPLQPLDDEHDDNPVSRVFDPAEHGRRTQQGLLIGGVVVTFVALGLSAFLLLIQSPWDGGGNAWAVGLIPGSVGIALLISAFLVRPRGGSGPGTH